MLRVIAFDVLTAVFWAGHAQPAFYASAGEEFSEGDV